ncbi:DNA ligase [endosymbiont of Sipalinus gigas]|uniref:NAD-dependent DNA ligase LigA n=1 Tax=endosymbiont of Sipalinus gigas TaxID=1972134 RepID=UPI000DC6E023|nr:NAD-dependent DNA ligase LigA [endosymbiont of Sipalinus gigas]BBA85355.1 DNA ligase [endosymbiont of Sipalinus gigas]
MKNTIYKKINLLKKKIRKLEYNYYINNKSIVSDYNYDLLINKLINLENKYPKLCTNNSPTKKIYDTTFFNKKKIKNYHIKPMLSIKNTYCIKDIINFDKNIHRKLNINNNLNITYCCEVKIDGIALSIVYKNGKLIKATTRGNGLIGEDVTKNISGINNIPLLFNNIKHIPNIIEIRGEIYISNIDFNKLKLKNKKICNSRNLVSGFIRKHNIEEENKKYLNFINYGIGYTDNINTDSHYCILKYNEKLGLKIDINNKLCNSIKDVINYINSFNIIKKNIEYQTDGIVIKVNSIKLQNILGVSYKYPNWLISYKFTPEKKITKLIDIIYEISKNGIITPIGILLPIIIDGSKIKKISLFNINYIKKIDIMIGDYVYIKKSGNVIPNIESVLIEKRKNNLELKKVEIIKNCPSCKNNIESINNTFKCISDVYECKSKLKSYIFHFVSKNSFSIYGLGKRLIELFVNENIINDEIDIFNLHNKININNKLKKNIIESINKSKNIVFYKFIYSLNIKNIGIQTAINISKKYKSIYELIEFENNKDFLLKVVNKKTINNILTFFKNSKNIEKIKKLIKIGINIIY